MLDRATLGSSCLILTPVFLMATQLASALIWVHILTSNYCRMMGPEIIVLRIQMEGEKEVLVCSLEMKKELMRKMDLEEDLGWPLKLYFDVI